MMIRGQEKEIKQSTINELAARNTDQITVDKLCSNTSKVLAQSENTFDVAKQVNKRHRRLDFGTANLSELRLTTPPAQASRGSRLCVGRTSRGSRLVRKGLEKPRFLRFRIGAAASMIFLGRFLHANQIIYTSIALPETGHGHLFNSYSEI